MALSSLLAAILAFATLLPTLFGSGAPRSQRIDRIIGAGGFNLLHPVGGGTLEEQRRQIAGRLAYLEELLSTRDVRDLSPELRAARMRNIALIHEYRLAGAFPRNFDHPDRVLPCFIDREGTICAVGYLVEKSDGQGVAEEINRSFQYATVAEMRAPQLDRWIASSGLTREEVMTIQEPAMRPELPFEEITIAAGRDAGGSDSVAVPTVVADTLRPVDAGERSASR